MKRNLILLFLSAALVSCAQCIISPDSINYLSKKTRLHNYCGDINAFNKNGFTILIGACSYGKNLKLIEDCLKHKADIFIFQKIDSSFHKSKYFTNLNACGYITFPPIVESLGPSDPQKDEYDKINILKLFIKYRPADSAKIFFYAFESLLKYDDYCNNVHLFEYLRTRVDLNHLDTSGNTYLHIAIKYFRKENAMWLCKAGSKLSSQNNEGETPLDFIRSNFPIEEQEQLINSLEYCYSKKQCSICK